MDSEALQAALELRAEGRELWLVLHNPFQQEARLEALAFSFRGAADGDEVLPCARAVAPQSERAIQLTQFVRQTARRFRPAPGAPPWVDLQVLPHASVAATPAPARFRILPERFELVER